MRLLQEDNKRLRERIRVLEQNLAEAHDVTAQVEANLKAPSAQENQQLKGDCLLFSLTDLSGAAL